MGQESTLYNFDPGKIKPGSTRITFHNEDGTKSVTLMVSLGRRLNNQPFGVFWRWEDLVNGQLEEDRHEAYMLMALNLVGTLLPPEK